MQFNKDLEVNDLVRIAGYSSADKVSNQGIYEMPSNLEVNAKNSIINEFTYGQILNHLKSVFTRSRHFRECWTDLHWTSSTTKVVQALLWLVHELPNQVV